MICGFNGFVCVMIYMKSNLYHQWYLIFFCTNCQNQSKLSWKITAWRHFRFLKQKTDLTQKNSDSKWWFCSLLLFSNNFQFCHRWCFLIGKKPMVFHYQCFGFCSFEFMLISSIKKSFDSGPSYNDDDSTYFIWNYN